MTTDSFPRVAVAPVIDAKRRLFLIWQNPDTGQRVGVAGGGPEDRPRADDLTIPDDVLCRVLQEVLNAGGVSHQTCTRMHTGNVCGN